MTGEVGLPRGQQYAFHSIPSTLVSIKILPIQKKRSSPLPSVLTLTLEGIKGNVADRGVSAQCNTTHKIRNKIGEQTGRGYHDANNNVCTVRKSPKQSRYEHTQTPAQYNASEFRAYTLNVGGIPLRFHRALPHRDSLPLRLHQLARPTPLLRNLVTDGNDRLVRAVAIKIRIQILQSSLHGFRIQEIDDGQEHEVEGREDDVEAVADVLDAGRGELRADEAEEPVGGRGGGGTAGTHGEGVDFGLVDPRDHAPCAKGTSVI